jgi:hypothetical protein
MVPLMMKKEKRKDEELERGRSKGNKAGGWSAEEKREKVEAKWAAVEAREMETGKKGRERWKAREMKQRREYEATMQEEWKRELVMEKMVEAEEKEKRMKERWEWAVGLPMSELRELVRCRRGVVVSRWEEVVEKYMYINNMA